MADPRRQGKRLAGWLLASNASEQEGPYEEHPQHAHPWWRVMCLSGVDYFSTLGYQPGIAALAAGALSPLATVVLVLLTLFGALPIYRQVAAESPHGEGSIAMLEHLLPWWQGKLFVLALLGFAATDFIITITLSAADATAHVLENPFAPAFLTGQQVPITLLLIIALGIIFLVGFREAIGVAVALVIPYIALNLVVLFVCTKEVVTHPTVLSDWRLVLTTTYSSPLVMIGLSLLLFPKLALGLSGFETGVSVMPLVRGTPNDDPARPAGRICNTRRLLTTAALMMSALLIISSIVTTLLIPPAAFQPGGAANGRALAYLAHLYLGETFGTIYDIVTILILWFAGASAMAGLLNIVPRYLPRYGMAPEWARANRPLVLIFIAIAFVVTIFFRADVDAQGGAYATGVLVLMTSAAIAVTLSFRRRRMRKTTIGFAVITVVFIYTTIVNIFERTEGLIIASLFILAIIVVSLASRIWRATELRVEKIELDAAAERMLDLAARRSSIRLIANSIDTGDEREYDEKELEAHINTHLPSDVPALFLEIAIDDASEFSDTLEITGREVGSHRILRGKSSSAPNAIAAFLLYLRERTGKQPHIYFTWTEGSPLWFLLYFLVFGQGDVPGTTRDILRRAEPDSEKRPIVHVGG